METLPCYILFEKTFPFWGNLTQQQKKDMCDNTVLKKFKKGDNVHGTRSQCTGLLTVKNGNLRAYMRSEEGKEVTLYRLFEGDICTLAASCVLAAITFDVFMDAETDAEVFLTNPKVFGDIMQSNMLVENYGLNIAVQRFSDVMWAMQQVLFMSLDSRIAVFLYEESVKTNSDTICFTQEEIAKYTGSAREAVSRMLKYFAGEGIVEVGRGEVKILNKKSLKALIQEV